MLGSAYPPSSAPLFSVCARVAGWKDEKGGKCHLWKKRKAYVYCVTNGFDWPERVELEVESKYMSGMEMADLVESVSFLFLLQLVLGIT